MKTLTDIFRSLFAEDKAALTALGEEEILRAASENRTPFSKLQILRAVTPDADFEA